MTEPMIEDPKCPHSLVARKYDSEENFTDKWLCARCGAEFYHLDLQSGNITVMEPMVTLRDQFAMAALKGLMAANWKDCPYPDGYAKEAYMVADAMMKARKESV